MIYNEIKEHGTYEFPIELYSITKEHPKYEMAYHYHSQVEIIKVLYGELKIKLNNTEYICKSGDIVFVNVETVHGATPINAKYECLVFDLEILSPFDNRTEKFIDDILNRVLYINEYYTSIDVDFCHCVSELLKYMKEDGDGKKFNVIGTLYRLFGLIMNNKLYSEISPYNSLQNEKNTLKLKKALSFIRKSYNEQITLEEMASVAGMSPKYFCRFFKQMTTKTPIEYLKTYRIERAARRLLNSDSSITEIAFSCGFNDLSYFVRTFKSIKGIPPGTFRKN